MSTAELVRAWKDPEFRATLTTTIPDHPAGQIELKDPGLEENAAHPHLLGSLCAARGTQCICHQTLKCI